MDRNKETTNQIEAKNFITLTYNFPVELPDAEDVLAGQVVAYYGQHWRFLHFPINRQSHFCCGGETGVKQNL